jgi:hypothetical protein
MVANVSEELIATIFRVSQFEVDFNPEDGDDMFLRNNGNHVNSGTTHKTTMISKLLFRKYLVRTPPVLSTTLRLS